MKHDKSIICPCQSGKSYSACCEPFHLEKQIPATAELLMRSRYSAYTLKLNEYIKNTWHPSTYTAIDENSNAIKWIGLKIHNTRQVPSSSEAFVEFTARYKVNGKAEKMHEISRFICEQNRWLYVDGILSEP